MWILCAGNSEYLNVRKHGGTHPLEQTWQQQGEDSNIPLSYTNLMGSNPGQNQDSDYEVLYGPVSGESVGGSQQGFPGDSQQEKRTVYRRVKRDAQHVHGLQRLTSLGQHMLFLLSSLSKCLQWKKTFKLKTLAMLHCSVTVKFLCNESLRKLIFLQ